MTEHVRENGSFPLSSRDLGRCGGARPSPLPDTADCRGERVRVYVSGASVRPSRLVSVTDER